jgi:hypothetical protein
LWRSTLARTGAARASAVRPPRRPRPHPPARPCGGARPRRRAPPPPARPHPRPAPAPAPAVTPAFACYYEEGAAGGAPKEVEVVFVTSDHDDDSFQEYFSEMPWTAVPFAFEGREAINDQFKVVRLRSKRTHGARARAPPSLRPPPTPSLYPLGRARAAGGHPARGGARRRHGRGRQRQRARKDRGEQELQGGHLCVRRLIPSNCVLFPCFASPSIALFI